MKVVYVILSILLMVFHNGVEASECREDVHLQILGAGGPELDDGRTSSGYLVWVKGEARLLLDTGSGTSVSFGESGGDFAGLDVVLLSHLHTDHSADLPAFVKGSFFTARDRDLFVMGPTGNHLMPATSEFVQRLFAENGAFSYLSGYLQKGRESYQLIARDVSQTADSAPFVREFEWGKISAIGVHHGPIPALAWRIDVAGCSLVYSGDMSDKTKKLVSFAAGADLLLLHMAIPENAHPVAQNLHMSPGDIANIAKLVQPKTLVLSHLMKRSEAKLAEALAVINEQYRGNIVVAERLLKVPVSQFDGAK